MVVLHQRPFPPEIRKDPTLSLVTRNLRSVVEARKYKDPEAQRRLSNEAK